MSKKSFFDNLASSWDELYYSNVSPPVQDLVSRFKIKEGSWVLDVGSGTGILLPYLLKYVGSFGKIIELDLSFQMLKKAQAKNSNENINFINSDVGQIPLKENLFDYVVCFGAFAHFSDKKKALIEMVKVLKKRKNIFIAHLLSSEEIKMYHKKADKEVAFDVLPKENKMIKMMEQSGIINIKIIDRPSLYLASGIKK